MSHNRSLAPQPIAIPVWSGFVGSWHLSVGLRPYSAQELANRYDREAASWSGTLTRLGFDAAYGALMDQVAPELPSESSLRVLDAGIGTGALSAALVSRCRSDIDLVGVDLSRDMLRQAAQALRHDHVQARLICADVVDLACEASSCDVVLAAHVLEHAPSPEDALAELARVLKPGGLLIICLTRKTTAGRYMQLKWRTHRADHLTALSWLQGCRLRPIRTLPLQATLLAGRLRTAFIAIKDYITGAAPP